MNEEEALKPDPVANVGFFKRNWQDKSCEMSGLKCWSWISYYKQRAATLEAELLVLAKRIHNQREEINRLAARASAPERASVEPAEASGSDVHESLPSPREKQP